MSRTLLKQLREYTTTMDGEQIAVSPDEVASRVDPVREIRVGAVAERSVRYGRVALVAAALAAVVVSVPLLVMRGTLNDPIDPGTSVTSSVPSTTKAIDGFGPIVTTSPELPRIAALPAVPEIEWETVNDFPGPSPDWISAYPGGGFVASGIGVPPLYSLDGRTWTTEPFDVSLRGARDVYIEGRYALEGSTEARLLVERYPSPWQGRVWCCGGWDRLLSYDGDTWKPVPIEGLVIAPPVVSGNKVLVQVRVEASTGSFDRYGLSIDGGPFEVHPGPPGGGGPINDPQVFAMSNGRFGVYWETGALWASDDGISWYKTFDFGDFTGERIGGPRVLVFRDTDAGLIAQRWRQPFAWIGDGSTFTEALQPEGALPDAARYLVPIDGGFVLASLSRVPQVWTSSDGRAWQEVTPPLPMSNESGPESGRVSIVGSAMFYWYHTTSGDVVLQIAQ